MIDSMASDMNDVQTNAQRQGQKSVKTNIRIILHQDQTKQTKYIEIIFEHKITLNKTLKR